MFRDVVDSRDVLVIELRSLLGFLPEPATALRVLAMFGADRLHGDSPLEQPIFGKKYLAHSATAESGLDDETFVTAAHVDGSWRHGHTCQGREVRARPIADRRPALDLGTILGEIVRRASGDSSSLGIRELLSPGLGTGVRQTIEMPPTGADDF